MVVIENIDIMTLAATTQSNKRDYKPHDQISLILKWYGNSLAFHFGFGFWFIM